MNRDNTCKERLYGVFLHTTYFTLTKVYNDNRRSGNSGIEERR